MDGVPQLEPPTFEEAVIVAFKGLPSVLTSHQPTRKLIIVKLLCPGHQGRGLDEIIPQLKQAFLAFWDLDRTEVKWLRNVHFHQPTDDIIDGHICRTWLLANGPMGHDWHTPWDGRSPGLYPKEFLASEVHRQMFPYGIGAPGIASSWQSAMTDREYRVMRDRQIGMDQERPWLIDPMTFTRVTEPVRAAHTALERNREQAQIRFDYRVPDISWEQRDMGRLATQQAAARARLEAERAHRQHEIARVQDEMAREARAEMQRKWLEPTRVPVNPYLVPGRLAVQAVTEQQSDDGRDRDRYL